MMATKVRIGERVIEAVDTRDGRITIEGQPFSVTPAGPGLYAVSDGRDRWLVAVAGPPEARWVAVDGAVATVEMNHQAAPRQRRKTSQGDAMAAPMPATVVSVAVAPGQVVSRGETVVLLEAMKMELPVRAPRDGVVKAVRCTAGELVQPGNPLVELEPVG